MIPSYVYSSHAAMRVLASAGLGLALSACPGLAQQLTDAQKSALRSSCRSDYMANCMSVSPGGKDALICLHKNLAKLSPACQQAVDAAWPKPPAAVAPPPPAKPTSATAAAPSRPAPPPPAAAEAPKPARAAKSAKRRHVKAKRAASKHAAAPPPPPAPSPHVIPIAKIEHLSLPERLAVIHACMADQHVLCDQVRPGGGRIIVCLAQHDGALSPPCRQTLARMLR